MRALVVTALLVIAIVASAHASPQPWSVDVTYRGTASITAAGDTSVPSAYASSLVTRIEHTTRRWFYGVVLAIGIPGMTGQGESSISGGLRHVVRDGVLAGPTSRVVRAVPDV